MQIGEADSKSMQSKNKSFTKTERNLMKHESKELRKQAFSDLDTAGGYFSKIGMARHAAQCYCTAQKHEKAALMFELQVDYGQSAECYLKVGNLHKASEYYAKAGLFANAFECYERL
jgi:tetratricopeptide (TPR) repeat protein